MDLYSSSCVENFCKCDSCVTISKLIQNVVLFSYKNKELKEVKLNVSLSFWRKAL